MESTCRPANACMISKIDYWILLQALFNSRNHCQTPELETILPANSCDAAHHHYLITAKLKQQNHAEISFTNYEFASRNYVKQSAGCVFWAA